MNNEHEFLSPEELRVWLGIGRTKCYEILSHNEIPSYKIGKVRRIKRADVSVGLRATGPQRWTCNGWYATSAYRQGRSKELL